MSKVLTYALEFSGGGICRLEFDLTDPKTIGIKVTPFSDTEQNWKEFEAWRDVVTRDAVGQCTQEQLFCFLDTAADLIRRLNGESKPTE